MARQNGRAAAGGHHGRPANTPRLRLKPKASTTGHVDGAWWPRRDDLSTELPDLLAVLSLRLGAIDRVTYNLAEWATVPRRLTTDGRAVRLDGYQLQPTSTLQVLGVSSEKILLLVVPPQTQPEIAHEAMMTAAAATDASAVGDLLAIGSYDGDASNGYHRPTLRRRVRRFRP